jgi:hypothetical protein
VVLYVLAHIDSVDDVCDDWRLFAGIDPAVFPAWEALPTESDVSDEILADRLRVLKALAGPGTAICRAGCPRADRGRTGRPPVGAGPPAIAGLGPGVLTAVKGATGAVIWRKNIPALRGLSFLIDQGRVVYQAGTTLVALDLQTGNELWQAEPQEKNVRTLVAGNGLLVIHTPGTLEVHDGATGKLLWHKPGLPGKGLYGDDLFIINGVIWPGMLVAEAEGADGLVFVNDRHYQGRFESVPLG